MFRAGPRPLQFDRMLGQHAPDGDLKPHTLVRVRIVCPLLSLGPGGVHRRVGSRGQRGAQPTAKIFPNLHGFGATAAADGRLRHRGRSGGSGGRHGTREEPNDGVDRRTRANPGGTCCCKRRCFGSQRRHEHRWQQLCAPCHPRVQEPGFQTFTQESKSISFLRPYPTTHLHRFERSGTTDGKCVDGRPAAALQRQVAEHRHKGRLAWRVHCNSLVSLAAVCVKSVVREVSPT